jgi:hypothetical protein
MLAAISSEALAEKESVSGKDAHLSSAQVALLKELREILLASVEGQKAPEKAQSVPQQLAVSHTPLDPGIEQLTSPPSPVHDGHIVYSQQAMRRASAPGSLPDNTSQTSPEVLCESASLTRQPSVFTPVMQTRACSPESSTNSKMRFIRGPARSQAPATLSAVDVRRNGEALNQSLKAPVASSAVDIRSNDGSYVSTIPATPSTICSVGATSSSPSLGTRAVASDFRPHATWEGLRRSDTLSSFKNGEARSVGRITRPFDFSGGRPVQTVSVTNITNITNHYIFPSTELR